MKNHEIKNKYKFILLVLIFPFILSCGTSESEKKLLQAVTYDNGSIAIMDGEKTVTVIEGNFCFPGFKNSTYFEPYSSIDNKSLKGIAKLSDGTEVVLNGSVESVKNGLKIKYDITPLKSLQVKIIDADIRLLYKDWINADYQLGLYTHKLTYSFEPNYWKSLNQCVIVLGPSKVHDGLFLEVVGEENLGASISDFRPSQPMLSFHLESDKFRRKSQHWEKGKTKSISFTVIFNRPVNLMPQIHSYAELKSLKNEILKTPIIVSPTPNAVVVTRSPADSIKKITYDVPSDAKEVDFHVSNIAGYHIFVPCEIEINGKEFKGSLLFDTGIWNPDGDIHITNTFSKKLGLKFLKKHTFLENELDSINGSYRKVQVEAYVISNDERSDAGPINVRFGIGSMKSSNASLFALNYAEGTMEEFFDPKDEFFVKNPLIGSVPWNFEKKFLTSVDYKNSKIYFRPIGFSRRTFFDQKPLAELKCVVTNWGIYCPYSINKKDMGYAILDTGCPKNYVNASLIDATELPISSYIVGGYDVLKNNSNYMPLFFKNMNSLDSDGKIKLNRTSCIGNDFFKDQFITIDPLGEKIYIESIP